MILHDYLHRELIEPVQLSKIVEHPAIEGLPKAALMLQMHDEIGVFVEELGFDHHIGLVGVAFGQVGKEFLGLKLQRGAIEVGCDLRKEQVDKVSKELTE